MKDSFFKIIPAVFLVVASLLVTTNSNAQTKELPIGQPDTSDLVFSKVEVEASFPGGLAAWAKYVTKAIMDNSKKLKKSDYGTCVVKFIVSKNGSITDVAAITMQKSRLAKIAVDAIANGPRWIPAMQNGVAVNAYRLQPVTLSKP